MQLTEQERTVLAQFRQAVDDRFPGQIRRVVVFGSKARGEATEESDIDVLVIAAFDDWKKTDEIRSIGYALDADIGYRLSIQVLSEEHVEFLRDNHYQFIENVTRDGVAV